MNSELALVTGSFSVNLGSRFDIPEKAISYSLASIRPGLTRFEVAVDPEVMSRADIPGDALVVNRFRGEHSYGKRPDARMSYAAFAASGYRFSGEIDESKGLEGLRLELIVKNAEHRILASGYRPSPDFVEITEPAEGDGKAVGALAVSRVVRQPERIAPEGSLVHIRACEQVTWGFDVELKGPSGTSLQMPTLLLNPAFDRRLLTEDPFTRATVLPELTRRILFAMVVHADEYSGEPWYKAWARFAVTLLPPGSDLSYLRGDCPPDADPSPDQVSELIREAVARQVAARGLSLPTSASAES